ncbi:MAG TPA: MIP/aquaporin family protein [Pirellulaceae bacterium]|jgi:glycerol uptake facilitator protein|nr:MIP/aquaporin family protein [Pirellulaceae bacterium]
MELYVAEMIGTIILVLLGNGVVANVVLRQTKGHNAGWIAIAAGWGFAVYTAVLCVKDISGAHLNPAVTIGLAVANAGGFEWNQVPGYIAAQMIGAIIGAILVYLFYKSHLDITDEPELKLATFCTAPNIRNLPLNMFSEVVATFVLVYAALCISDPSFKLVEGGKAIPVGLGSIGALPVGLIVFAIGLSLGGTTGYAINPARDLGPRIAHSILPILGKGSSDWGYAAVPVIGPIVGGILAACLYLATPYFATLYLAT